MKRISWPGHGYKFTCHRCGFQFPSTEIKKEWTGLYVCNKDYEARHPQTLIKIRGEQAFPSVVSKDSDVYVGVCNVATKTAFADLGTADCMQADNNTPAYNIVKELFTNGH